MKTSRKPAKLNKQQPAGSRNTHPKKKMPKSGLPASRAFLFYILTLIFIGFLLEIALRHNLVQGSYIFTSYCGLIVLILGWLAHIFYDMYQEDPMLKAPLALDADPWADIWERIVHFIKNVQRNALCVMLICFLLWTSGVVAWAELQMGARIHHAGKEFITYDSSDTLIENEGKTDTSSPEQPATPTPAPVELPTDSASAEPDDS